MTSLSECSLDQFKIDTRLLFVGNLTKQPRFQDVERRIPRGFVKADISMHQTLWLGTYPDLGEEQLDFMAKNIEDVFVKYSV
jgi:CDP-6-deoxy-D-xylo-4-hexulose-3-dehydrase